MDDETIRLILDMGGSAASVEEVRKKLDALKGTTHTTADAYEVLERQVGEYEVLERRVVQTTQQVVQAQAVEVDMLQRLGIETQVAASASAKMGHELGKDGNFGRGVQSAAFAIQDFTSVLGTQGFGRALGAVQNNIPIVVASLGAGAGLAGAISIVSIGVGLLIDNWDKLTGAWGKGETAEETKRQKDLAKAIEATAAATEKLLKTPGPEQRAAGKDIQRAIDAFGGHAVQKEIEEALKAKQGDFGAEANRKMARDFVSRLLAGDKRAVEMLGDLDLHGDIGAVLRGGKTPEERFKLNNQAAEREIKEHKAREEAAEKKAKDDAEKAAKEAERMADEKRRGDERLASDRKQAHAKAQHDAAVERHQEAEAAGRTHQVHLKRAQAAGIGEQALDELTRIRQAGGDTDKYERFHFMSPAQQEHAVAQKVERSLKWRFPDMSSGERHVTAGRIARDATVQLRQQLLANQQQMTANLDAQQQQLDQAKKVGEANRRISRQRQQPMANYGW